MLYFRTGKKVLSSTEKQDRVFAISLLGRVEDICFTDTYGATTVSGISSGGRGVIETAQALHAEKYSILVVDDNMINLLCLQQILLVNNYEVIVATDGYQAIEAAERKQPDMILLDVMMPEMDGFETCRRLKASSVTENIPIIFVTALSSSKDMVTGLELGGVDYIIKPYNTAEVLARIKTQLKVVVLNRELRRAFDFQEGEVKRRTAELQAANEALRTSRNLLQNVLDAVPELLFVVDRELNILFSNDPTWRMSMNDNGCPTCSSQLRKLANPCRKCSVLEVFNTGRSVEREVIGREDERVWEIRAFPIYDEKSEPSLVVEYIREVTTLKQAQREIVKRRQFLEAVLEYAPDAIVTLDEVHHVIDWNPGAVRMFGFSPEEAQGRHLDILVAQGGSLAEAGEKTQVILSGRVVEPFETIRQRRDNTSLNVIAAASPIMIDGLLAGAVAVYTDISALKSNEEELRRSHERFLTVMESIDATIYVADMATHEILFMNQQMMKRFGRDLTGGVCWRDLRGQSGPCPACPNSRLLDDQGDPTGGCSLEDFDPAVNRWFRNNDRAIKWVDQRLVRLQMATDITDQKRIEQERKEYERRIQQLQKMEAIGTLAGGIAHDFNNILSAVFGYAELALIRSGGNQVLQRNLGGILEAAKRAKELVQQILLFSRQGEQELKPLQIRPLIKESLKMLRSSLPTTIKIRQQIQGDFENVLANPTQIHQIIMNLCANAAQAMEEDGGVLTVGLSQVELTEEDVRHHPGRAAGLYLKLRVQDTGRGIPAELVDKIYNPYFTTKAKGQGTGLGLSVVHGIVQSYSGLIELGSDPGRGTVFEVFLPAIEMEAAREELPVIQLPGGSEHILLVDDEEALIEVLGDMLRLLGYRVTATTSSADALGMFQARPADFDLIITDMTMPGLTGDRLTAEVRADRPDLPVIICTGYNRRLSDNNPESLAVQAILMKPVEHIDFARTVRAVLDGEDRSKAAA